MERNDYARLARQLNIILRAADEFDLKVNVDDLYAEACDLIDDNGIDRYVTDDEFTFDWHHLSWNDGMGYQLDVDGEYNDQHFMRAVNGGKDFVDIKSYEVKWGKRLSVDL